MKADGPGSRKHLADAKNIGVERGLYIKKYNPQGSVKLAGQQFSGNTRLTKNIRRVDKDSARFNQPNGLYSNMAAARRQSVLSKYLETNGPMSLRSRCVALSSPTEAHSKTQTTEPPMHSRHEVSPPLEASRTDQSSEYRLLSKNTLEDSGTVPQDVRSPSMLLRPAKNHPNLLPSSLVHSPVRRDTKTPNRSVDMTTKAAAARRFCFSNANRRPSKSKMFVVNWVPQKDCRGVLTPPRAESEQQALTFDARNEVAASKVSDRRAKANEAFEGHRRFHSQLEEATAEPPHGVDARAEAATANRSEAQSPTLLSIEERQSTNETHLLIARHASNNFMRQPKRATGLRLDWRGRDEDQLAQYKVLGQEKKFLKSLHNLRRAYRQGRGAGAKKIGRQQSVSAMGMLSGDKETTMQSSTGHQQADLMLNQASGSSRVSPQLVAWQQGSDLPRQRAAATPSQILE